MTSSLRSKVLGLTGRRYSEKLYIPGLGDFVARNMTELERGELEAVAGDRKAVKRFLVIKTICDAKSQELVFLAEDFEALALVDSVIIDKLVGLSLKMNEISEEDVRKLLGEPGSN